MARYQLTTADRVRAALVTNQKKAAAKAAGLSLSDYVKATKVPGPGRRPPSPEAAARGRATIAANRKLAAKLKRLIEGPKPRFIEKPLLGLPSGRTRRGKAYWNVRYRFTMNDGTTRDGKIWAWYGNPDKARAQVWASRGKDIASGDVADLEIWVTAT